VVQSRRVAAEAVAVGEVVAVVALAPLVQDAARPQLLPRLLRSLLGC
jgi:hypothetical protein